MATHTVYDAPAESGLFDYLMLPEGFTRRFNRGDQTHAFTNGFHQVRISSGEDRRVWDSRR